VKSPSSTAAGPGTAVATLLAPVVWGTTYITVTELLPDGRPFLVAAVRVLPAGLALLAAGALVSRWRPRGGEWWRTALLALFNFGAFFPLLVVAVYRLPGGVAAAAGGLQPLLVGALSWLLAGRRPRRLDMAVGVVAALGVALVVVRPGAGLDGVGVLAAVAANLSFAVGVVLTKRYPTPANRLAATGWQLLLGGVLLVPLTLVAEGMPPAPTGRSLAGFAYLGLVGTALTFVLWFNGIRRLPAAAPPLLGLAAPVTGAALGWAVLGESLSPLQLVGFVITLSAIAYGALLPAAAPVPGSAPAPAPAPDQTPGPAAARHSALGLEQLQVELDLHDVAEHGPAHTGRQRQLDAEVAAADLGGRLEAGVAAAVQERLEPAELDGQGDRARDLAQGQVAVDPVLGARSGDARRPERQRGAAGDVDDVGGEHVGVALRVAGVERGHVDGGAHARGVERVAHHDLGVEAGEPAADLGYAQVADGEPDRRVAGVEGPEPRGEGEAGGGVVGGRHGRDHRPGRRGPEGRDDPGTAGARVIVGRHGMLSG
jgi:probable blue pigment (indigoidine) exporter